MSHISTVSFNNVKGTCGSHALLPFTLITGPNRSNKSTILDAIRVALLGYYPDPDVPKTKEGTMRLSDKSSMDMAVSFADRRLVSRAFSTNGKSVSSAVNPPEFKIDPKLAICLDPSIYFGKSEAERVQAVINLSEGLGAADRVPALIARLKMIKLKEHDQVAEQELTKLIGVMPQMSELYTVQSWLAIVLEWAKDLYKTTNATLKGFDQTGKILTEANAIDTLANVDDEQALTSQLKAMRIELDQKQQAAGKAKAERTQMKYDFDRRQAVLSQLAEASKDIPSAEEQERDEAALDKYEASKKDVLETVEKIILQQSDVAARIRVIGKEIKESDAQIEYIKEHISAGEKELNELTTTPPRDSDLSAAEIDLAALERQLVVLNSKLGDYEKSIAELQAKDCCPFCKSSAEGWASKVVSHYETLLRELIEDANKVGLQVHDKEVAISAIKARLKSGQESVIQLRNVVKDGEVKKLEIEKQSRQRLQLDLDNANQVYVDLADKIQKEKAPLVAINKEIEAIKKKTEVYARKIAKKISLEDQLKVMPEVDLAKLPEIPETAELERQIFETDARLKVFYAQQAEAKRVEQVTTLAKGLRINLELIKQIGEAVKDEQAKIVEDAFGPVLRLANDLCRDILPSPLVYHEGAVCRWSATSTPIHIGVLSGSEKRLAFAAISAGLAAQAKDRIAIIDELGTFDTPSKAILINNIRLVLKRGDLDQVILAGPEISMSLDSDIRVITTR